MYEKYFQLNMKPFELIPNPEFLYLSSSHKKAITYLDYGIREKVGFILLTGEIGSGKTTILRRLISELKDQVILAKVFNTNVTFEQLLALINEDFGLDVSCKDKISLLSQLNDFLVEQYSKNNQCILIIDEAQNLTLKLLEEIRMLSNLETDHHKLLQIILVGQPELRQMLTRNELQQLRQRISISCHIHPLKSDEVSEYIFHRLETAGNRNAMVFPIDTIEMIYKFSQGIPRLVNIICDFLMLSAYVEERHELSIDFVKDVIGEIEAENRYWVDRTTESTVYLRDTFLEDISGQARDLEECRNNDPTVNLVLSGIEQKLKRLEVSIDEKIVRLTDRSDENEKLIKAFQKEIHGLYEKIEEISCRPISIIEKKSKSLWSRW